MPKMRHPESSKTIDVAPAQVPMYESQGWVTKAPAAKKSSARKTTTTATTATTKE